MKELFSAWSYWVPVLISIGILLLYRIAAGRWSFAALLLAEIISAAYFLVLPTLESAVLPSIALSCVFDRLIAGWKKSSWPERIACIILAIIPVVICGSAGVFIILLFQFLLSIIYILPRRKYWQEGKLKCFSLWIAQLIVFLILSLPQSLNREASFGIAIYLMPVIATLALALYDLFSPSK